MKEYSISGDVTLSFFADGVTKIKERELGILLKRTLTKYLEEKGTFSFDEVEDIDYEFNIDYEEQE